MALTEEERAEFRRFRDAGLGAAYMDNRRGNMLAELRQGAHDRAMEQRRNFIERNPHAVSHFERQKTLDEFRQTEDRRLGREHAIRLQEEKNKPAMEQAKNELERIKQEWGWTNEDGYHKDGARERIAGMEGRTQNYIASLKYGEWDGENYKPGSEERIAEIKANSALEQTRLEMKGRNELAKITEEGQTTRSQGEWGITNPDGTFTPGARERIAETGVKQAEATARAQAQQLAVKEQTKLDVAALNNQGRLEQARINAGGKVSAAQVNQAAGIVKKAIDNATSLGKSSTEAMGSLAEEYKNNPEMLEALGIVGAAMTGGGQPQKTGGSGVYQTGTDGVKYEIVFDANGKPVGKRRVQ